MLSIEEAAVVQLIERNRQEVISYLQQLIQYRTITPQTGITVESGDYRALQQLVAETLKQMAFSISSWEVDASQLEDFPGSGINPARDLSKMPVVVGQKQGIGEGRSLILNGHYDVVPPGELGNWKYDPFSGEVEDGRIYGRGACDMKGGIAAMLMAIKFIQQAGVQLAGDLTVQVVPDEEMSCMGTLACCQQGYRADAAIIPEPVDMNVLVAMRGSYFGFIHVYGRAGHAELAQPHWREGGAVNAVSKAAQIVTTLDELNRQWEGQPERQHKYVPGTKVIVTSISGGEWEVTYPEKAEIGFSLMFPPGGEDSADELVDFVAKTAAKDDWMAENPPLVDFNPVSFYGAEISEEEPIAQLGKQVLGELGYAAEFKGFGSLTDAIHLINAAKVPTISIGPGGATAHATDEYVEIDELVDTTKALALAVMRWCGVVNN